ncbi:hypothetical protein [Salinibaculum rarum]|uniref:hypothetical protein n=1 Tax=Salinibaculum rarum TaxID=3058903 RepID=UPI00265D7D4F|nr:hypothetical protein [Salinibaculum sp. KK48]
MTPDTPTDPVLVRIEHQIGDQQVNSRLVCDAPASHRDAVITAFFNQFYGPDTEHIDENRWESSDLRQALTVKEISSLTETEYDVLQEYLPNITARCPNCHGTVTGNPMDDDAALYCAECNLAFDPE